MRDYNRILVFGHCETSKEFIVNNLLELNFIHYEKLRHLTHPTEIINGEKRYQINIDILNFISKIIPDNNILLSDSDYPKILNELSLNIFKNWKFVYISRSTLNGLASHKVRVNKELSIDEIMNIIETTDNFYQRVKHQCVKTTFEEIFLYPQKSISRVFNYLNLPEPDVKKIQKHYHNDERHRLLIKNKLRLGTEFEEVCGLVQKKEIKEGLKERIIKEKQKALVFTKYDLMTIQKG